jgi:hypothetical protein
MSMLREFRNGIKDDLRDISARLAVLQKDNIAINASITLMAQEYSETRVKRLEDEAADAEKEKELLEKTLQGLADKIERKRSDTVSALTTSERIQKTATMTYEDIEKNRKELQAAAWKKRFDSVITAVMVSLGVPLGLAVAVVIIRFIAGVFHVQLPGLP